MATASIDQRPKAAVHGGSCELVLGVDTHKDVHVAAVLTALGALLATRSFPATRAGYRDNWKRKNSEIVGTLVQRRSRGVSPQPGTRCA